MQNNSYQQIAKEFMDLWQKQVSAVITDKQFIQSMLEMFQTMQMPDYDRKSSSATASHTAASPDANHELLAELAFRLSMCEKRIAALEEGSSKKNTTKSSKKPAARKTTAGNSKRSTKPRK